jgi:hypothetical protein
MDEINVLIRDINICSMNNWRVEDYKLCHF